MDLLEIETKRKMRREEAAEVLREIADALSRQNSLQFDREGKNVVVRVPDQVEVEIELDVEDEGGSLEIEINW